MHQGKFPSHPNLNDVIHSHPKAQLTGLVFLAVGLGLLDLLLYFPVHRDVSQCNESASIFSPVIRGTADAMGRLRFIVYCALVVMLAYCALQYGS